MDSTLLTCFFVAVLVMVLRKMWQTGAPTLTARQSGAFDVGSRQLFFDYQPCVMKTGRSTTYVVFPARVEVRLVQPFEVGLVLQPESEGDRKAEWLGFSDELKIGDQAWDSHFRIVSDDVDVAREFLSRPDVRAALQALLAPGWHLLSFGLDGLTVTYVAQQNLSQEQLSQVCEHSAPRLLALAELARVLNSRSVAKDPKRWAAFRFVRSKFVQADLPSMMTVLGGFSIFGIMSLDPLFTMESWVVLAGPGIVLAGVLILALRKQIAGLCLPHKLLWRMMTSFSVFIVFSTGGLIGLANTVFDESPLQIHHAKILDIRKKSFKGRSGRTSYWYDVQFEAPVKPRYVFTDFESVLTHEVSVKIGERLLATGSEEVQVTFHKGFLDLPWSVRISGPADSRVPASR